MADEREGDTIADTDVDSQQPLENFVLCSTAIDQNDRVYLVQYAQEMGALYRLDLTADVTHLIVGDVNTPKYKHIARSRPDVHVLDFEWIIELRRQWTEGHDIHLDSLTRAHTLPALCGLNICLTGFELDKRKWIQDQTIAQGAHYHGALTKQVTHLIVANTTGPKYSQALAWGITVVTQTWLEMSLERGMILDEKYFSPSLPDSQQGVGAIDILSQDKKRKRPDDESQSGVDPSKRKLRRKASNKLNSQSQDLWNNLSAIDAKPEEVPDVSWVDAPAPQPQPRQSLGEGSFRADANRVDAPQQQLFTGWICHIYGFDELRHTKVHDILRENGVQISTYEQLLHAQKAGTLRAALITPSAWTAKADAAVPPVPDGISSVTEVWVQRCIQAARPLEPIDDVFSQCLFDLPPDLFAGSRITCTGFDQDYMHAVKIIRAAGGDPCQVLQRDTTVLVCDMSQVSIEKVAYCLQRNVQMVTRDWLEQSLRCRRFMPLQDFPVTDNIVQKAKASMGAHKVDEAVEMPSVPPAVEARPSRPPRGRHLSSTRSKSNKTMLPLADTRAVSKTASPTVKEPVEKPAASILTKKAPFDEEPASPTRSQDPEPLSVLVNSAHSRSQNDSQQDTAPKCPNELLSKRQSPAETHNLPGPDCSDEIDKENRCESIAAPIEAVVEPNEDLAVVMSDLLARQQTRADMPDNADSAPKRRKNLKLGRAPSGSNTTVPPRANDFTASSYTTVPLLSQQLSYDAPGAEEHRRLLRKKLGTAYVEDQDLGVRVESLGLVKDAEAVSGVGGVGQRVRGRNRNRDDG